MVGTEMYVKIQELKRKGYKKQRAARELGIDTKTVRLYVCNLRDAEGIPAPGKIRQYCEVEEMPLGRQAQVDMGQQTMPDPYGKSVKVYIFATVMSASRQKYARFQLEPFTAQTFIEAHDQAFQYFGGRTEEIVYDQDRVLVVSENAGDIILTEAFERYQEPV